MIRLLDDSRKALCFNAVLFIFYQTSNLPDPLIASPVKNRPRLTVYQRLGPIKPKIASDISPVPALFFIGGGKCIFLTIKIIIALVEAD